MNGSDTCSRVLVVCVCLPTLYQIRNTRLQRDDFSATKSLTAILKKLYYNESTPTTSTLNVVSWTQCILKIDVF